MNGYSIHIGLNLVSPEHYPGISPLKAAVNDAIWWQQFALKKGFATSSLHDGQATIEAVKTQLATAASQTHPGDLLLITYSGHGGEVPNKKPDDIDKEKMDQTWCLYDEQLLDDELYECFSAFDEAVRIVVVSDSCHSGTMTRAGVIDLGKIMNAGISAAKKSRGQESRELPDDVMNAVMRQFATNVYRPKAEKYKHARAGQNVKASVKLLAACQDSQVTYDGAVYGIFTEALSKLLAGMDALTAETLIQQASAFYAYPKPNFFQYGGIIESFDNHSPFEIYIPGADIVNGYRAPQLARPADSTHPYGSQAHQKEQATVLEVDITGRPTEPIEAGNGIEILEKQDTVEGVFLKLQITDTPYQKAWAVAHALQVGLLAQKGITAVEVMPVLSYNAEEQSRVSRASSGDTDYISTWPPANAMPRVNIGWHLDDAHSQLTTAAKKVQDSYPSSYVRIGHIDTGYLPGHIALPQNIEEDKARSFVKGERAKQAIDKPASGMDGHGMGTMGLLAGKHVQASATYNEFEGFLGGAPMAKVVPIRISNSVIIFDSSNFASAIEYALEQQCDVVSMSMAGKPSPRMAKAVNKAYDEGLVIVSAASNCWYKGPLQVLPKCVLWPAAFERVIAATGAMYNHQPYDADYLLGARMSFTEYMQGSWGPASRMKKALAAYTPNTPWASEKNIIARSGGGTSSATPQIAATAALWIAANRQAMEAAGYYNTGNKWRIVEAVRQALYRSAAKGEVFADYKTYYGNGIVRAANALDITLADVAGDLKKSEKAESSFWGFFQLVGAFFSNRKLFRSDAAHPEAEALGWELLHLCQTDPAFYELFSEMDLENKEAVQSLLANTAFLQKVAQSPYASDYLKEAVAATS